MASKQIAMRTIVDVDTGRRRLLRVTLEQNGCTIAIEGTKDELVLDLSQDVLRVRRYDTSGEASGVTDLICLILDEGKEN